MPTPRFISSPLVRQKYVSYNILLAKAPLHVTTLNFEEFNLKLPPSFSKRGNNCGALLENVQK